jgi:hypothetical protein
MDSIVSQICHHRETETYCDSGVQSCDLSLDKLVDKSVEHNDLVLSIPANLVYIASLVCNNGHCAHHKCTKVIIWKNLCVVCGKIICNKCKNLNSACLAGTKNLKAAAKKNLSRLWQGIT